jgi:CheY-like chemotaxis protein
MLVRGSTGTPARRSSAVLGIVRTHNGVIAVDSGERGGTTFTILLPVVTVLPTQSDGPETDVPWRATGKVLVVDDERSVCETAAGMLEHLGFETVEAHSGPDAIATFERLHSEIRLVLLDHAMPEMTGAETLKHLRGINPDVPVIITSGYNEPEIGMSTNEPRAAGFIKKPYRLARFSEELRAALDAH